jgi:hypothetical protein
MKRPTLAQRLQMWPPTAWWWRYWIHDHAGVVTVAPWFETLRPPWRPVGWR